MLVRPSQALVISDGTHDAWELVNRAQQSQPASGYLIPQPAHSALAGDIAAKLSPEHFPGLESTVVRCIALHDTGWSAFDARQIEALRSQKNYRPISFTQEQADVFLPAWTGSIDAVEKITPAGGYMVSRHFESIGAEQGSRLSEHDKRDVEQFAHRERGRQDRIVRESGKPREQLEMLLQANRFCDLLSLFLCSDIELSNGAKAHFTQNAKHPAGYTLTRDADAWAFEGATPFGERAVFTFSG
ncbi:MAG TPA: DUF3891 family protein, partial [Terriglobales bacterium]